jgi:hypothetical protein
MRQAVLISMMLQLMFAVPPRTLSCPFGDGSPAGDRADHEAVGDVEYAG